MNKDERNALRSVVIQCRRLLEKSTSDGLQGRFGIHPNGVVEDDAHMSHLLNDEKLARRDIVEHFDHLKARVLTAKDALEQLVREIAFTHLNRLCAYKMMEAREVYIAGQRFREAVGRGVNSNGLKFYLAEHPDDERLFSTGHQDIAYRHFLDWLGSKLSEEIGVLFNPNDSANRLYPPQKVLDQVLSLINDETLADIWKQDETIGWVYQYFTPKEMRDKARADSRAPRDSNELAFRNQFFTPRYVVEFLVDNTLGRLWYEMRKGHTALRDRTLYMIRRPNEVFLEAGKPPPESSNGNDELSQEKLLKLPVFILHRPKKDPREIKVLDPASGSGHFLLYAFDLLVLIYEEAYSDPDLGPALEKDYPKLDDLRKDIPRLIMAHNLHGIDIDPRASQIAALALWLRCQRAYQELALKKDRFKITRSNFVCAEPMPGESDLLKEFVEQLEPKLLGQLVEVAFGKMKLAGEAGSLLKIEDEIRSAIASAKVQWLRGPKVEQLMLFGASTKVAEQMVLNFSGITDVQFFEQAEASVVQALKMYAEDTHKGNRLQRRLFAQDAAQGFSFIELCHRRFDVVLMNPPFGELSKNSKSYIESTYENSYSDILAAFVERTLELCLPNGFVGAITNRNCFYLTTMTDYRKEVLQRKVGFEALLDLGEGVLDAMVEAAVYVLRNVPKPRQIAPFVRLLIDADKGEKTLSEVGSINAGRSTTRVFYASPADFSRLESTPFCYWVPSHIIKRLSAIPAIEGTTAKINVGLQTGYDWRFLRTTWEVSPRLISPSPLADDKRLTDVRTQCLKELSGKQEWSFFSKTDVASPWYSPITLLVKWEGNGFEIKNFADPKGKVRSRPQNESYYFRPGYSYVRRTTRLVPYVVPCGVIPTAGRSQIFPEPGCEIEVLGTCASKLGSAVARFYSEKFAWPMFQASMVQAIPAVPISAITKAALQQRFNAELAQKRSVMSRFEPWHEFILPAVLDDLKSDDAWQLDSLIGTQLEEQIAADAGLSKGDLSILCRDLDDAISTRSRSTSSVKDAGHESEGVGDDDEDGDEDSISLVDLSPRAQAEGLISYCLGVVFGRWDVRFAQDRRLIPKGPDVLDPLPVVPPGTLVSTDGYPATTGTIVSEAWLKARPNAVYLPATGSVSQPTIPDNKYPVTVQWNGVIVDFNDEHGRQSSPNDIGGRIQGVFEVIFGKEALAQEKAACEALEVTTLCEYLRKPGVGGFWLDHVARYSKSRRKAPIYWLLQSKNKSFGLWVYYHRLDRDMLFKVLQASGPVETKINLEQGKLEELYRRKKEVGDSGREAKKVATAIAEKEDLLNELRDFSEKLERAASLNFSNKDKLKSGVLFDPDLNDGVALNIAAMHELVPWKEAKKYWTELLAGKHEWSSIGKQLRAKGLV